MIDRNKYGTETVMSDSVELKTSGINGKGMSATRDIKKGEVVCVKGGHILTREQLYLSSVINSYQPIDDTYLLGARNIDEEEKIKVYINHSCDPNCGLSDEVTFVAMRDIGTGEELSTDYALIDNEEYEFECSCGSECCRKTVTGFDWKIQELQRKYQDYFSPYLKEKIEKIVEGDVEI